MVGLIFLVATAALPSASAWQVAECGNSDLSDVQNPEQVHCALMKAIYRAGCFQLDVSTPSSHWTIRGYNLNGVKPCNPADHNRLDLYTGDHEASGHVSFHNGTPSAGFQPGRSSPLSGLPLFSSAPPTAPGGLHSAQSTDPPAVADAGFDIYFHLRLDPCADPVFDVDGDAYAQGPSSADPERAQRQASVSARAACDAAQAILHGATGESAGDFLEALLLSYVEQARPSAAPSGPSLGAPSLALPGLPDAPAGPASPEAPGGPSLPEAPRDVSGETHNRERADADGARSETNASLDAGAPLAPLALEIATPEAVAAHAPAGESAPRVASAPLDGPQETRSRPGAASPEPSFSLPQGPAPSPAAPPAPRPVAAATSVAIAAAPTLAGRALLVPAGAAIGLAAAAALIARALLGLYSRITRDDVLDHPLRRRAYEAMRARRAATPREIANDLGADPSTTRHHLETLRRSGLLGRVPSLRGPVFHLAEARAEAVRAEPAPLQTRVLDLVAASPGINASEVARALGVSKCAAQNHVLDLLASGRLVHRREGGARLLYPATP